MDISQKRVQTSIRLFNRWPDDVRGQFLIQLGEMLEEGFSLQTALEFCSILYQGQGIQIKEMIGLLDEGDSLNKALEQVGFSQMICAQSYLGQRNGSLTKGLKVSGKFLMEKYRQRKKLEQKLVYPIFLLGFTLMMIFMMRMLLLPQIKQMVRPEVLAANRMASGMVWIFEHFPQIVLGQVTVVGCLYACYRFFIRKKTALEKVRFWVKVPFLSGFVIQYYTYVYCREFAEFLMNGQSILQMVDQMQLEGNTELTKELSHYLQERLAQGFSFSQSLLELYLFREEFIWLVIQGEMTNSLPYKLEQYSEQGLKIFLKKIEQCIAWVQPLLFLLIGFCILGVHIMLMLPTITMIGG